MTVEILAPVIPIEFICCFRVMACDLLLKFLITTPRWFFEEAFFERKMGTEFHSQHAAVESFMGKVVQPLHEKHPEPDPWIEGDPFIIPLPEKCYPGEIQPERGSFCTCGVEPMQGQIQFNWDLSVPLRTTKEFHLHNAPQAATNFAGLDDADAM